MQRPRSVHMILLPFGVTKEPEATAYVAVELTFEPTGTAGATPAPRRVR